SSASVAPEATIAPENTVASAPNQRSSSAHSSSSAMNASIDSNRASGSFAIPRATAAASLGGTSGRSSRTPGGGSSTWRSATATAFSPLKGTRPVSSSNRQTASE